MPILLTYAEVQEKFAAAWKALPSMYRNDTCLTFFLDCNENLCALFDLGGECMWDDVSSENRQSVWIRLDL